MGKLDTLIVSRQVTDIVFKEFAGHPKVYIWDGEGIPRRLALSCSAFILFAQIVKLVTLTLFVQNLTLTWDILHGLMLLL